MGKPGSMPGMPGMPGEPQPSNAPKAEKGAKFAGNPPKGTLPTLAAKKGGDSDRDARQYKEHKAVIKRAHRPLQDA